MDEVNELRRYLNEVVVGETDGARAALAAEDDLLASGIVDSLTIIKLISFIEERWSVEIPDTDILPENFQTIEAIAAYVAERRKAG